MNPHQSRISFLTIWNILFAMLGLLISDMAWTLGSNYKLGKPETRSLVVENYYMFTVQTYEERPKITPIVSESKASYSTPEDTLVAHHSAMVARDYEWFIKTWAPQARDELNTRNMVEKRDRSYWISVWERVITGRDLRLLNRINYGAYVLVQYELSAKEGVPAFRDTLAFKKEGDRWLLSQDLAADPVLSAWNVPGSRIKSIAVPPPTK